MLMTSITKNLNSSTNTKLDIRPKSIFILMREINKPKNRPLRRGLDHLEKIFMQDLEMYS